MRGKLHCFSLYVVQIHISSSKLSMIGRATTVVRRKNLLVKSEKISFFLIFFLHKKGVKKCSRYPPLWSPSLDRRRRRLCAAATPRCALSCVSFLPFLFLSLSLSRFFFLFYYACVVDLRVLHHLSSKPRRRHPILWCIHTCTRVILLRFLFVKSLRSNYHNEYYQRRIFSFRFLFYAHISARRWWWWWRWYMTRILPSRFPRMREKRTRHWPSETPFF